MAITLRLTEDEIKTLEKIQKKLDLSTYSKTILHLINRYDFMSSQLHKYEMKASELSDTLNEIKQLTAVRKNAELQITEVLKQLD